MSWKEFFKPSIWKIILFFIIGAIVIFLEFMNICTGPGPNAGPLVCISSISGTLSIFYILLNPFLLLSKIINGKEFIFLFTSILFLLLQVIYVYTISSIIVLIIGKIKNRN